MTRPGDTQSPHARCAHPIPPLAVCSVTIKVAGAGFLFSPHEPGDDTAKCFYCGIELSGWDPEDDPVYVPFISPVASTLTLPERSTGGGSQNGARNAPFSPQESRNSLRRRRPSAKLRPKRPYKLKRPSELVPPKSLIQNPTLMTKKTISGGVPVLGQPRPRKPPLELLPEVPPAPDPEPHPRLPRRTNRVGATLSRKRSPKPRGRNERRGTKHRRLKRRMSLKGL